LWFLNDLEAVSGELRVDLHDLKGQLLSVSSVHEFKVTANSSLKLANLEVALPPGFKGTMVLTLSWLEGCNRYIFSNLSGAPLREVLAYPALLKGIFEK
jgi:hypothetical protein